MSFEYIQKLPTPDEIRDRFPLTKELAAVKAERDKMISDVFTGKSDKFLVIIGPCSADNEDSVCEYVSRLGKLNERVQDKLILIPRIYTNKPRTTGEGYKGITSQPDPEGKTDFHAGLIAMRHMQLKAIEESGLTAADEMLYPENWGYVADILSYVAIGARSVEDQAHRMTASGFDVPAGMKNPTSGTLFMLLSRSSVSYTEATKLRLMVILLHTAFLEVPAISMVSQFLITTMRTFLFYFSFIIRERLLILLLSLTVTTTIPIRNSWNRSESPKRFSIPEVLILISSLLLREL